MAEEKETMTIFESGAVRDIHGTKGRFDLLPHDVIGRMLYGIPFAPDIEGAHETEDIYEPIYYFRLTGNVSNLYYLAEIYFSMVADRLGCPIEKARLRSVQELAKHFQNCLSKYPARNWEKGIPVSSFIDSALRHYTQWQLSQVDEPHEISFLWNIVCAIWTVLHRPDLNDFSMATKEYEEYLSYHKGYESAEKKPEKIKF